MNNRFPKTTVLSRILILSTLILATLGCAGSEPVLETDMASEIIPEAEYSVLEALYWSRVEASRVNFTQADIDFMTDMIAHHAQALIMSRLAPENGAGQSVRALAARIHNAQEDEIRTMQTWLCDRGQPVPKVQIEGLNLIVTLQEPEPEDTSPHEMDREPAATQDHNREAARHVSQKNAHHHGHTGHHPNATAMHHHHDMPGMLSPEQLEELAGARGTHFDRLFLQYMIEHHKGAIIMVDTLFNTDGAALDPEAFRLASDIHVDQITEIERMRQMLGQRSDNQD